MSDFDCDETEHETIVTEGIFSSKVNPEDHGDRQGTTSIRASQ